jgi:hypothetical protein
MKQLALGALLGSVGSLLVKSGQVRELGGRARKVAAGAPPPREVLRRVATRRASTDELEALTKEELYERAQAEDVAGRSEMTKDELIAALRARRSEGA